MGKEGGEKAGKWRRMRRGIHNGTAKTKGSTGNLEQAE
jgi:hypothetical protein